MLSSLVITTLVFDSLALHLPPLTEVDTARHELTFRCLNTGKLPVIIDNVCTACGCTQVLYHPTVVHPHQSDSIVVSYATLRRNPGLVDEPIFLYLNGDTANAAVTLRVLGTIQSSPAARWSHLPQQMGQLLVRRKALTFRPADTVLRIPCANPSRYPVHLTARQLPQGISLRIEPPTVLPGKEADIVVAIDREALPPATTTITLEGPHCELPERQIQITIEN